MKIPLTLKIAGLVLVTTAFYTYIGQLVPQKEVQAPQVVELRADMTTEDLVRIGKEIANGKGLCLTCHTIGKQGALRFPDLEGIAARAGTREPGLDALGYMSHSLYAPDAYIVPGFNPGMPKIDKPPIDLTDQEIRAVLAYLQTLGGTATITMETQIPFAEGAAPSAGAAPTSAAAGAPAPDAAPSAAPAPGEAGQGSAAGAGSEG